MAKSPLDQILKLNNAQKAAILAVIVAIMGAAFFYLIFMPQQETLKAHEETIVKLQSQYNEQQNILSNLPRFRQELKTMQSEFEESLKMLPNAREIPSLLTNVSTLAQESGLEITQLRLKPEIPMDFYAQIPVEMRVTGRYHQIGVFFDKLAHMPRIINIADLGMIVKTKSGGKTQGAVAIDASFDATTFKFIESTGSADARKKQKTPGTK